MLYPQRNIGRKPPLHKDSFYKALYLFRTQAELQRISPLHSTGPRLFQVQKAVSECRSDAWSRLWKNVFPGGSVIEHYLPEKAQRGSAVLEQFVVEFTQGKGGALLALIILPEFENLEFAQGVIEVAGIKRAAHRLLPRR